MVLYQYSAAALGAFAHHAHRSGKFALLHGRLAGPPLRASIVFLEAAGPAGIKLSAAVFERFMAVMAVNGVAIRCLFPTRWISVWF